MVFYASPVPNAQRSEPVSPRTLNVFLARIHEIEIEGLRFAYLAALNFSGNSNPIICNGLHRLVANARADFFTELMSDDEL